MRSSPETSLQLTDAQGKSRYWWSVLPWVPESRDSPSYGRLRRVWFDHTWANHPFLNQKTELHLTATLFENFAALPVSSWISALGEASGLPEIFEGVTEADWGYEVFDGSEGKYADIAIHVRDARGDAVLLVEAKRKGGPLKKGDSDPATYLDKPSFSWSDRRYLIYLVDEADRESTLAALQDPADRSGILTWQQLGGIQVRLAQDLPCDVGIRAFVTGAIQYQYAQHGILPDHLSAPYLVDEPPRETINAGNENKQTTADQNPQSWRMS